MKTIAPTTTVVDAIYDIKNGLVLPVINLQEKTFLVDVSRSSSYTLIWTEFNKAGVPVESWQGRYSNYHTFIQMFRNPVPKTKYDEPIHSELPTPPDVYTIPQILAGYKD